jgi:transcriptional antiterminator NusG
LPLSDKEVREIMARIGKEQAKPKIEISFKVGDTIRVKSGPMEGQAGPVVEIVPEKGKVKFTVNFLGREVVTETDYFLLEKI